MKGHVYIIQMLGTDFYKIGMTTQENPYKRIKDAETYAPQGIKEIKIIESVYPLKLEKELHTDFKHKREKGEWFKLNKDDLKLIEDKYSVSQGKLLKTLEKCLTFIKSEELLYSILKSSIQGKETKEKIIGNSLLKEACISAVESEFKDLYFSSSDVLSFLKKKDKRYSTVTPQAIGAILKLNYTFKMKWVDGKSKRCYFNEKNRI